MKILIIDLNQEKNSIFENEFVIPITQILKNLEMKISFEIKHYKEDLEDSLKNCDKIILSGVPMKDNSYLKNLEMFQWILLNQKPILGICGGFQIIGIIFGGKLEKNLKIGMKKVKMIGKSVKKINLNEEFQGYFVHSNSLEEKSLEKFEIIARTEEKPSIIAHKNKNILGMAFHPEVKNEIIIKNFINYFG